jgi:ribosomal protein S18 acetylase RimI-like enzyme
VGGVIAHAPAVGRAIHQQVVIRRCSEHDLRPLEWEGHYTEQRSLIVDAWVRQGRGEVIMLVADAHGYPVGQLWVDLEHGVLWSFRVMPALQGRGIGSRLLDVAEACLAAAGFGRAELGCEVSNLDARRLYERRGYRKVGHHLEHFTYDTPDGRLIYVAQEIDLMHKLLPGRDATVHLP